MIEWLSRHVKRIDVFGVGFELREPSAGTAVPLPDPPLTPATADDLTGGAELSCDAVIAEFVAAGGKVGKTASPDGSEYHIAAELWYVRCRCGWDDETYGCHEYIGRNARGVCFYACHDLRTGLVTFGRKGFHYCRLYAPECV